MPVRRAGLVPLALRDACVKNGTVAARVASGCRFTTRILFRIMNHLPGFSSTATFHLRTSSLPP